MAGTKLADLSLQITPCKEGEKRYLVIDFVAVVVKMTCGFSG
jgi:hypothetical protein